jgi:trimeric autotransporter adhesin
MSMTSSLVSTASLPIASSSAYNNTSSLSQLHIPQQISQTQPQQHQQQSILAASMQSSNTLSTSSIAIIDVNNATLNSNGNNQSASEASNSLQIGQSTTIRQATNVPASAQTASSSSTTSTTVAGNLTTTTTNTNYNTPSVTAVTADPLAISIGASSVAIVPTGTVSLASSNSFSNVNRTSTSRMNTRQALTVISAQPTLNSFNAKSDEDIYRQQQRKFSSNEMPSHMSASTINNDDKSAKEDVKYKFVSNETIGVKSSMNNEYADSTSVTNSAKFNKCPKCLKCCSLM